MQIDAIDDVDYSYFGNLFDEEPEMNQQQAIANTANAIVNLGLLVVNLQRMVEDKHDAKIGGKLGEIDALHDKIAMITDFLEHLEGKLGVDDNSDIDFTEHQALIDGLNEHFPHDLLDKTQWSRAEGEALSKAFQRRMEQVSRLINPKMVDVNHMMEDRHEMLTLVREILKMWREMIQGMTRNQKGQ